MRKIVVSLLGACLCFTAKAQFSVALVAGPQFNSVTPSFSLQPDTTSSYSASKHTGLNLGLIANAAINKKQTIYFRTGVLYSAKGSLVYQQFDTSNLDFTNGKSHFFEATSSLKINYIDVPVNLLLKLPLKGKTKFLLGGGVQASLFYNGSTDLTAIKVYKEDPDSTVLEYSQVINNDLPVGNAVYKYKTLHLSANTLTGFEFGRVFLTASYSRGLTDFYRTEEQSFLHSTLGFHLGIFLGSVKPKEPAAVKDRDKDGIADNLDGCPGEPGTALTNGCPDKDGDGIADKDDSCPELPGTVQNKGCPVFDRDSDGIRDEDDKCPDVAGTIKYNGCPVPDTDKDGVNDEEDKCPTVAGEKNNMGCPKITVEEQKKISYAARSIQFEFKKADLLPSSFTQLNDVYEILKANPTLHIRVEGHTSGPDSESNRVLSQKRAESVKAYFIQKGIADGRILAQGFGSARHISKDGDKTENPVDRRVELIVF